jgi:hypothetical protein
MATTLPNAHRGVVVDDVPVDAVDYRLRNWGIVAASSQRWLPYPHYEGTCYYRRVSTWRRILLY